MITKRFINQASAGWTTYGTFFLRSRSCRNERRPETMKIDRIYKIYRMRRKKISPVNLVNPVYFPRRRRMKSPCKECRRLTGLHWLFVLVLISLFHPRVQAQVMGDA